MSTYNQYNIKGYLPYKKYNKRVIEVEHNDDKQDYKIPYDVFELETFVLTFFLYNAFFNGLIWFLSFPPIGLLIYPLKIIMNGFTQACLFSLLFTAYVGFMKGYHYRKSLFETDQQLYHPEIHVKVMWKLELKYVSVITYTPDLYEKMPEWAYELFNDYNDITYRTLFRWMQIIYYYLKDSLIALYVIIDRDLLQN